VVLSPCFCTASAASAWPGSNNLQRFRLTADVLPGASQYGTTPSRLDSEPVVVDGVLIADLAG